MCRAGTASAVPLSAGFFRELLLRDDLAKPGHVLEEQLKAVALRVAGGVRDVARLRAARPRRGRSHWAGASDGGWLADLFLLPGPGQQPGCCPAARDPLAGHGGHSPERGIEHPFAPVDFLAQVQDQRRELGRIARPDPAGRMRPGCAGACGACSLPPARPPRGYSGTSARAGARPGRQARRDLRRRSLAVAAG